MAKLAAHRCRLLADDDRIHGTKLLGQQAMALLPGACLPSCAFAPRHLKYWLRGM
jgi:hypothetical protein